MFDVLGLSNVVFVSKAYKRNANGDVTDRWYGNAQAWLKKQQAQYGSDRLTALEISEREAPGDRSWSRELNKGFRHLASTGVRAILTLSKEVELSYGQFLAMLEALSEPGVAVVGVSFQGYDKKYYPEMSFRSAIGLGKTYEHMRDTCALYDVEAWLKLLRANRFGFDPKLDLKHGMEDNAAKVELEARGIGKCVELDLRVPIWTGVNYNKDQSAKELREQAAVNYALERVYARLGQHEERGRELGRKYFGHG